MVAMNSSRLFKSCDFWMFLTVTNYLLYGLFYLVYIYYVSGFFDSGRRLLHPRFSEDLCQLVFVLGLLNFFASKKLPKLFSMFIVLTSVLAVFFGTLSFVGYQHINTFYCQETGEWVHEYIRGGVNGGREFRVQEVNSLFLEEIEEQVYYSYCGRGS